MIKSEFLKMMHQDLETHSDKEQLMSVLLAIEEILKDYPLNTEIDHVKTVESCYKAMYEYAAKNKKGNSYLFDPQKAKDFITNYLGLKKSASVGTVDLEDFM